MESRGMKDQPKTFYPERIRKVVGCWNRLIEKQGYYFVKITHARVMRGEFAKTLCFL
jgi:hypothetical protein